MTTYTTDCCTIKVLTRESLEIAVIIPDTCTRGGGEGRGRGGGERGGEGGRDGGGRSCMGLPNSETIEG